MSGPYTDALADLRRWRDHVDFLIASLEKLEAGAPLAPPSAVARAARAPRATVDDAVLPVARARDRETDILAALEIAGGSMGPGELATQLKMPRSRVRTWTALMVANGALVVTGSTANRRFSLPAKEGL